MTRNGGTARYGLVAALVAALLLAVLPGVQRPAEARPADGGVVVTASPGTSWTVLLRTLRDAGATGVTPIPALGRAAVRFPGPGGEAVLSELPGVATVETDPIVSAAVTPNDTYWSYAWGHRRVDAPLAWDLTTGSSDVVVAVLDTGVDADHPDLEGGVLPGRDLVNDDSDASDDQGHGTMAAGIVAARTNNARGVAGTCWTCDILPVKVLGADGTGTSSAAAAGVVWATDQGADVISMSFGSPDSSQLLRDAVAYAEERGVVLVAAAGNSGTADHTYPAAFSGVVAVAGSTSDDGRYSWSNFGQWVDVAAPGCNPSTMLGDRYGEMCGTSSATPLVSGLVALLQATAPDATADDVVTALRDTSVDRTFVDAGRVDAYAAVRATQELAVAPVPEDDTTEEPVADDPDSTDDTSDGTGDDDATADDGDDTATDDGSDETPGDGGDDTTDDGDGDGTTDDGDDTTDDGDGDGTPDDGDDEAADDDDPVEVACPESLTSTTFDDVSSASVHTEAIACVVWWGIAKGTGPDTYEPAADVTRGQMATFLARLVEASTATLPTAATDRFTDDDGSPHEAAIEQLAAVGIAQGVTTTRFAPHAPVSRDQMATFLVRTFEYVAGDELPPGDDRFSDDDGNAHEANIDKAAAAGFAAGVEAGHYEPRAPVRRDQMATFLSRVLESLVDAGLAVPPIT